MDEVRFPRRGRGRDELVLDTAQVRAFVAEVQATIGRAASPEEACEAIRPRFAELLADPSWLPAEYQAEAPESGMGGGIGQWLLYRAGDGSLSWRHAYEPGSGEARPFRSGYVNAPCEEEQ